MLNDKSEDERERLKGRKFEREVEDIKLVPESITRQ
jgi:hypothetical protein